MTYHLRILIYRFLSLGGLVLLSPVLGILAIVIKIDSKGPFLFKQKRMGRWNKPFTMYKIRTMTDGAQFKQKTLRKKNEVDGPVFKIRHDPRYTRVGKVLSHTGLDEIPQLINVVKGEMSLVGPRPLPVGEAVRIPKKYRSRFDVLPGMTSEWIVRGAHTLRFSQWMHSDIAYAKHNSLAEDIVILGKTLLLVVRWIISRVV